MQKKLLDFAAEIGLDLSENAATLLVQYAGLVWQKKDMLNLTSVADENEIITRHICDGLTAAAFIAKHNAGKTDFSVADMQRPKAANRFTQQFRRFCYKQIILERNLEVPLTLA